MTTPLALARNAITALTTLRDLGTREPTPDERDTLALWPGWGPLAPALSVDTSGGWTAIADELDALIPVAELNRARDIVDTSFYTSPAVVTAVFDLLRATGFTAGRILEPGCGSGNFMSGAPADLAIEWTGVEIDPTAARFAKALNPAAEIIGQPLQKVALRSNAFDAVLGNVPFAAGHVYDRAYESGSLHEYFTLRALDAVRAGCHVIIVTSRHMIDGEHGLDRVREQADLVSAVRLPSGSFDGTDVVADILVLRKRAEGEAAAGWGQPMEEYYSYSSYGRNLLRPARLSITTGAHEAQVNAIWADHLDCVAGTLTATSFFKSPLDVVTEDPDAAIRSATTAAASFIEAAPVLSADHDPFAGIILEDVDGRKAGSYHVVDGLVFQIVDGKLTPTTRATAELRALIILRDAATELIDLESHPDRPDHEIAPARAAALALYEAYVLSFGALNRGNLIEGKPDADTGEPSLSWRRPLMGGFRKDPEYVSVLALEQFDQDTGEARPAPILLRRVGAHPPRATSAASAVEALAIAQGEGSGVNLGRIGELIGEADEDTVLADLGDLVYRDPAARGQLTIARDYLSGDVRTKLSEARTAGETNPTYWRNVAALEAVIPALLGPLDIRVQLGATWITADDVREFTKEVFGRSVRVEFTPAVALWEVDANSAYADAEARIEYGTTRMSPYQLVSCALNGKTPVVTDEAYNANTGKMINVRNQAETLAAEEKLRAVQERFGTWVWEDQARSDRLVAEYNRRFNSHVIRRGDGAYLTFPGLDETRALWSWQRDAVDRIISQEKVMIAHPVGAGKTLSIICGAMTLRRMGLARKPLIVVPNHLLEQIAREAQQAYPTGRFLIASKEDLAADSRRLFAARCATGDWDAVVITHQAFTSIGVDAETESLWLEQQKSDLRWHMQSEVGGSRGAKAVASAVRKLESRISELRHGTRDANQFTFEQLGIDHVSVDEAHMFRRLQIATRAEGF